MEGMTTDLSIEILPEGEKIKELENMKVGCSAAYLYGNITIHNVCPNAAKILWQRFLHVAKNCFWCSDPSPLINREDNQYDELTRICSNLLQEYKQAPINDATEDDWLISIENYVDDTTDKPQIQRIPLLREKQSNKNCYDPLVVSIGPCHHENEKEKEKENENENKELKAFEKLKTPIAQKFVRFFTDQISIEELHEKVAKMGKSARKCYEKGSTEEYDDESFNKMMFLDGCFVLYFIIYTFLKTKGEKIKQEADPLHGWSRYLGFVRRDLFLLENQIPFPVLKDLMKLLFKSERLDWETELIQKFLIHKAIMPPQENSCNNAVDARSPAPPHLLHLVREQLIGSSPEDPLNLDWEQLIGSSLEDSESCRADIKPSLEDIESCSEDIEPSLEDIESCSEDIEPSPEDSLIGSSPKDIESSPEEIGSSPEDPLNLDREQLIESSSEDKKNENFVKGHPYPSIWAVKSEAIYLPPSPEIHFRPSQTNHEKFAKWHSYRSVTELKSAGIHFRPSQTNHVTDVKFKSHLISSTLTLPQIVVGDSTKDLLLNLAAYEMGPHGPDDNRIMSYICLMDSLIDHAGDVRELRKRRIIVNHLGSDEELAQLFNEIANDLVFDPFVYADVKRQIQNHCDSKVQVWIAEWMHDHFSSPWTFLAFLGVIFVIALTVVQTYFAVFPH